MASSDSQGSDIAAVSASKQQPSVDEQKFQDELEDLNKRVSKWLNTPGSNPLQLAGLEIVKPKAKDLLARFRRNHPNVSAACGQDWRSMAWQQQKKLVDFLVKLDEVEDEADSVEEVVKPTTPPPLKSDPLYRDHGDELNIKPKEWERVLHVITCGYPSIMTAVRAVPPTMALPQHLINIPIRLEALRKAGVNREALLSGPQTGLQPNKPATPASVPESFWARLKAQGDNAVARSMVAAATPYFVRAAYGSYFPEDEYQSNLSSIVVAIESGTVQKSKVVLRSAMDDALGAPKLALVYSTPQQQPQVVVKSPAAAAAIAEVRTTLAPLSATAQSAVAASIAAAQQQQQQQSLARASTSPTVVNGAKQAAAVGAGISDVRNVVLKVNDLEALLPSSRLFPSEFFDNIKTMPRYQPYADAVDEWLKAPAQTPLLSSMLRDQACDTSTMENIKRFCNRLEKAARTHEAPSNLCYPAIPFYTYATLSDLQTDATSGSPQFALCEQFVAQNPDVVDDLSHNRPLDFGNTERVASLVKEINKLNKSALLFQQSLAKIASSSNGGAKRTVAQSAAALNTGSQSKPPAPTPDAAIVSEALHQQEDVDDTNVEFSEGVGVQGANQNAGGNASTSIKINLTSNDLRKKLQTQSVRTAVANINTESQSNVTTVSIKAAEPVLSEDEERLRAFLSYADKASPQSRLGTAPKEFRGVQSIVPYARVQPFMSIDRYREVCVRKRLESNPQPIYSMTGCPISSLSYDMRSVRATKLGVDEYLIPLSRNHIFSYLCDLKKPVQLGEHKYFSMPQFLLPAFTWLETGKWDCLNFGDTSDGLDLATAMRHILNNPRWTLLVEEFLFDLIVIYYEGVITQKCLTQNNESAINQLQLIKPNTTVYCIDTDPTWGTGTTFPQSDAYESWRPLNQCRNTLGNALACAIMNLEQNLPSFKNGLGDHSITVLLTEEYEHAYFQLINPIPEAQADPVYADAICQRRMRLQPAFLFWYFNPRQWPELSSTKTLIVIAGTEDIYQEGAEVAANRMAVIEARIPDDVRLIACAMGPLNFFNDFQQHQVEDYNYFTKHFFEALTLRGSMSLYAPWLMKILPYSDNQRTVVEYNRSFDNRHGYAALGGFQHPDMSRPPGDLTKQGGGRLACSIRGVFKSIDNGDYQAKDYPHVKRDRLRRLHAMKETREFLEHLQYPRIVYLRGANKPQVQSQSLGAPSPVAFHEAPKVAASNGNSDAGSMEVDQSKTMSSLCDWLSLPTEPDQMLVQTPSRTDFAGGKVDDLPIVLKDNKGQPLSSNASGLFVKLAQRTLIDSYLMDSPSNTRQLQMNLAFNDLTTAARKVLGDDWQVWVISRPEESHYAVWTPFEMTVVRAERTTNALNAGEKSNILEQLAANLKEPRTLFSTMPNGGFELKTSSGGEPLLTYHRGKVDDPEILSIEVGVDQFYRMHSAKFFAEVARRCPYFDIICSFAQQFIPIAAPGTALSTTNDPTENKDQSLTWPTVAIQTAAYAAMLEFDAAPNLLTVDAAPVESSIPEPAEVDGSDEALQISDETLPSAVPAEMDTTDVHNRKRFLVAGQLKPFYDRVQFELEKRFSIPYVGATLPYPTLLELWFNFLSMITRLSIDTLLSINTPDQFAQFVIPRCKPTVPKLKRSTPRTSETQDSDEEKKSESEDSEEEEDPDKMYRRAPLTIAEPLVPFVDTPTEFWESSPVFIAEVFRYKNVTPNMPADQIKQLLESAMKLLNYLKSLKEEELFANFGTNTPSVSQVATLLMEGYFRVADFQNPQSQPPSDPRDGGDSNDRKRPYGRPDDRSRNRDKNDGSSMRQPSSSTRRNGNGSASNRDGHHSNRGSDARDRNVSKDRRSGIASADQGDTGFGDFPNSSTPFEPARTQPIRDNSWELAPSALPRGQSAMSNLSTPSGVSTVTIGDHSPTKAFTPDPDLSTSMDEDFSEENRLAEESDELIDVSDLSDSDSIEPLPELNHSSEKGAGHKARMDMRLRGKYVPTIAQLETAFKNLRVTRPNRSKFIKTEDALENNGCNRCNKLPRHTSSTCKNVQLKQAHYTLQWCPKCYEQGYDGEGAYPPDCPRHACVRCDATWGSGIGHCTSMCDRNETAPCQQCLREGHNVLTPCITPGDLCRRPECAQEQREVHPHLVDACPFAKVQHPGWCQTCGSTGGPLHKASPGLCPFQKEIVELHAYMRDMKQRRMEEKRQRAERRIATQMRDARRREAREARAARLSARFSLKRPYADPDYPNEAEVKHVLLKARGITYRPPSGQCDRCANPYHQNEVHNRCIAPLCLESNGGCGHPHDDRVCFICLAVGDHCAKLQSNIKSFLASGFPSKNGVAGDQRSKTAADMRGDQTSPPPHKYLTPRGSRGGYKTQRNKMFRENRDHYESNRRRGFSPRRRSSSRFGGRRGGRNGSGSGEHRQPQQQSSANRSREEEWSDVEGEGGRFSAPTGYDDWKNRSKGGNGRGNCGGGPQGGMALV